MVESRGIKMGDTRNHRALGSKDGSLGVEPSLPSSINLETRKSMGALESGCSPDDESLELLDRPLLGTFCLRALNEPLSRQSC